jgi:hypothetical protein
MCALLRELVVPASDLHRLAIECAACKAVTILDLSTRIQREGGPITPIIVRCCVCDRAFDEGLRDRVRALANVLHWLSQLPDEKITFRVTPPAE